jgi:outer membrane protein assembly factor BamB
MANDGGSIGCDGSDIVYSLVDLMFDFEPVSTESSPFENSNHPLFTYEIIYERNLCSHALLAYHMFSDDGSLVLVGINGISVWKYEVVSIDINTGQELSKYTVSQDKPGGLHLFSVSQDLSYVIEASYAYPSSPPVELKDFKTGELIQTFPDRIYHLNQTDYILSSKSSSPGFPREFKILDRALEEICTFKTQPSLLLEVHRSRIRITDEKLIAPTLGGQSIGVWDISSCELLWEFPLLSFSSIKNPISATGEVFFNDTSPYLDAISLETGERKFRLSSSIGKSFIGNQEDSFVYEDIKNNLLYIKAGERTFDIFDLESGKWLKSVSISADQDLHEVFITHDFSNMVYRSGSSLRFYYWDITNQEKLPLQSTPSGYIFQFSTKFEKIAFKTEEYLTICPFKTLENCKRLDIPFGYLPMVFSGDFDKLLFKRNKHEQALSDNESELDLKLFNVKTNSFLTLEATPKLYHEEDAFYVTFAFSPTEDLLVALYNDPNNHELHIWNSKTGAPLGSFNVPISARELWFTPDGSKIVVLAGGILYIIGVPCTFP